MAKRKILIAEDDARLRALYTEAFSGGYECTFAENGVDALVLAVDLVPDLILLDIMMPLLDGRTVCRKLKDYPKTAGIKVVMVTGKTEQSDRLVGFEVGADEYLEKPVPLAHLTQVVERLLR